VAVKVGLVWGESGRVGDRMSHGEFLKRWHFSFEWKVLGVIDREAK